MGGPAMIISSTVPNRNHGHQMERKLKKPLMEKRRRARINQCLVELKHILLQASPHQRTKLEKADILEMTVNYLRNKQSTDLQIHRQHYVDGYNQCSNAVLQYTNGATPFDNNFRVGLMNHLNVCLVNKLKQNVSTGNQLSVSSQSETKLPPGLIRPQPCIPLTLTIPHQRAGMQTSQLLPTPPFLQDTNDGRSSSQDLSDGRDLSPVSQSSSMTVAESASFSPCSHYSTTTPSSDQEDGRSSFKETVSVWRPW